MTETHHEQEQKASTRLDDGSGRRPPRDDQERSCCGIQEQLDEKRRKRWEGNKPQPWAMRKLAVGIVFAIVIYAWYVYVGRFCVPMIRRNGDALGSRTMGIVFLVIYCIFGLMFWSSYFKIILTPPGFARDYVQKTTNPAFNQAPGDGIGGGPYEHIPPRAPQLPDVPPHSGGSLARVVADVEKGNGHIRDAKVDRRPTDRSRRRPSVQNGGAAGADAIHADPKLSPLPPKPNDLPPPPPAQTPSGLDHATTQQLWDRRMEARTRQPLMDPILRPERRFCTRDEHIKPMRAHHCRFCGTCVLMFDHHCPWIGHCVGAFNYKFFVIFNFWSSLYTLWIFSTLVGLVAKESMRTGFNLDGQIVAIIALSGFFSLFTVLMIGAHVRMVLLNLTGVEMLQIRDMAEDENALLTELVPWCPPRGVFSRRRALKAEWNREWGELNTEGNIWWLGSARANWEYRMGKNKLGWVLPIGRSEGDGLTYPTNPRFDKDGLWRRRSEWPAELR